jgi:hypothetical protein
MPRTIFTVMLSLAVNVNPIKINGRFGLIFFFVISLVLSNVSHLYAAGSSEVTEAQGKIWVYVSQAGLGGSSPISFHTTSNTFTASAPLCSENLGFPCIDSLDVREIGGSKWTKMTAKVKTTAKKNCTFCTYTNWNSIPEINLPAGGESYNWSAKGFIDVSLQASSSGYFDGDSKNFGTNNAITYRPSGFGVEISQPGTTNAPYSEFQVHIKLGKFAKSSSGWFVGRLTKPTIDQTGAGELIISGGAVMVYAAGTEVEYAKMPPEYVSDLVSNCIPLSYCGFTSDPRSWNDKTPWQSLGYGMNNDSTFRVFSQWEPLFSDKAQFSSLLWSISNMRDWTKPSDQFGKCTAPEGFVGVVTSNATVFSFDPPAVNDGGLSYTVGATHLKPDGTPNLGTYGISLRKDLAKCIWDNKVLPESLGVEITYKDGVSKAVTTSLTSSENFYNFNSSGFGYSMPTLVLKEIAPVMAKEVTPAPEKVAIASNIKPKLLSIICIKGKSTKVVKSLAPKCPSGYKKK